jgi:molybdopterin-guanine dinucleotide biosynthesis protein B
MKVAALAGPSGSGKSTAIRGLIRHFVATGMTVGAIKHTHHPLNEEHRGDTAAFRDAGADPVILAGDGSAVVFSSTGTRRATFSQPADLLSLFTVDVVLVEGFKTESDWLQIRIDAQNRPDTAELAAQLEEKWRE